MIRRLLHLRQGGESGQTMIMFAVLASVLLGTMGLGVEGGRVFVEYRKMQAAADMAALIGAQGLPCATTDTTCITNAQNDACTYASNNGFSGCTGGGTSSPSANVPPKSCSPYDFMDYGNGATNASCKSATAPSFYDYLEVRLTDNLGTVPIFNVPVTLGAHAVAKRGTQVGGDYALVSLSPTQPLDMGGSTTTFVTGSVFSNGSIIGNGNNIETCDGGWYATGSISGVTTDTSGTPTWAPASCAGSTDATPAVQAGLPSISDPYGNSAAPPTYPTAGSFPNCPQCLKPGLIYDIDKGTWSSSTLPGGYPNISGSDNLEVFPGIYGNLNLDNKTQVFFNPGVYTFTQNIDTNHGAMCVYGAPDCGNSDCSTSEFTPGSAQEDQWYYTCSAYGFYDTNKPTPSWYNPSNTVPSFYDITTGSTDTTKPLNGVTIYLPAGTGLTEHGNGGTNTNAGVYLAAPNPCPGTSTYTAGPPAKVDFPYGSASGVYSYSTKLDGQPTGISSSSAGAVFPNQDFSLLGECSDSQRLNVWPGEMPKPQHLHFIFYVKGPNSDITMLGAQQENWTGLFYAPNSYMDMSGAGKGSGGPPFVDGQIIVDHAKFWGNSTVDVTYRGCAAGSTACGSGYNTQLVE